MSEAWVVPAGGRRGTTFVGFRNKGPKAMVRDCPEVLNVVMARADAVRLARELLAGVDNGGGGDVEVRLCGETVSVDRLDDPEPLTGGWDPDE